VILLNAPPPLLLEFAAIVLNAREILTLVTVATGAG